MSKLTKPNSLAFRLLDTIRREQRRHLRWVHKREKEGAEYAAEEYQFGDQPFLNGVCLVLLVTIWHEVERELVGFAARVAYDGQLILGDSYRDRVRLERELFRVGKTKHQVIEKLGLEAFPAWSAEMKTLNLLANCYKHDPSGRPDAKILGHLKMRAIPQRRPLRVDYAPLSESDLFREGLARSLALPKHADYCAIVAEMLARAGAFLDAVEGQAHIQKVKWGPVALNRFQG
jgi:hypothetical protein